MARDQGASRGAEAPQPAEAGVDSVATTVSRLRSGVRYSASAIGEQLPTLDRRTPRTGQIVRREMEKIVSLGLDEAAPSPGGGDGWQLTAKGRDLSKQLY